MADDNNKMEVEIALRDSISTGLKQIGREIDAITRKMKEGGDVSDSSYKKYRKSAEDAKDASDKAKDSVHGLAGVLTGMSRVLMGATGVAAGFIAVNNALENVGQKRIVLQNLAIDLGFTSDKIYGMQRALERVGVSADDSLKLMTNFGQITRDIFKFQYQSPAMIELQRMMEFDFAGKFLGMVNAGADVERLMVSIAKEYQRLMDIGNEPAARRLIASFQIPESIAKELAKGHDAIKGGYQVDIEVAQKYRDNTLAIRHEIEDLITYFDELYQRAYNSAFNILKAFDWKGMVDFISPPKFEKGGRGTGAKEPTKMGTFGMEGGSLSVDDYVKRGMADEDKKTNRLLGDIADTLTIFERKTSGGGGGGGGGDGGGSRYASLGPSGSGGGGTSSAGRAIRQIGRTSARVSQAKAQHGGGNYLANQRAAFFSEMDRDPQLRDDVMKVIATEMGGGGEGSQAVLESMVNRASMRGYTSLRKAVNDGFYGPVNRGEVARRGLSDSERSMYSKTFETVRGGSNLIEMRTNQGMINEGHGPRKRQFGGEWFSDMDLRASQWSQRQMTNIGSDSGTTGTAAEAIEFLRSRGGHDATLGKEKAPSLNPEMAIRLANAGRAYEAATGKKANFGEMGRSRELQAKYYQKYMTGRGGIAARPGFSRHQRGEATDIPRGDFLTWMHSHTGETGINFPVRGDPVHAQIDPRVTSRVAIDQSLQRKTSTQSLKGSVKAEVDFGNMPSAAKKSGDELGKFKLLKISPAPQGAKDHEGLMTPGDLAHTPYVP
jgi:hypothetical protein